MSDEPLALGFLTRDEEIRATAARIAATALSTGEYKTTAESVVLFARQVEEYIVNG